MDSKYRSADFPARVLNVNDVHAQHSRTGARVSDALTLPAGVRTVAHATSAPHPRFSLPLKAEWAQTVPNV